MKNSAKIKEIFTSIQGEGPFIGVKQLFIRFCNCNLNCDYCDTEFSEDDSKTYTAEELKNYILSQNYNDVHSISLTGGEPLIWVDFLKEFIIMMDHKFYLETNATLAEQVDKLGATIELIDIISADIKLPSTTGKKDMFKEHDQFFKAIENARLSCAIEHQINCEKKHIFAKVVFDKNITENEIIECCKLGLRHDIEIILQPKMDKNKLCVSPEKMSETLDKFLKIHKRTRLIPQVHKFINVR